MHKNNKQRPSISHWGDSSDSRAASATSRATHSVKYTTACMSLATAASRNYRDQADSGRIRLGSARRASEQVQTLLQAWMKYCSCAAVQSNRSTRRAERSQGNRRLPWTERGANGSTTNCNKGRNELEVAQGRPSATKRAGGFPSGLLPSRHLLTCRPLQAASLFATRERALPRVPER